MPVFIFNKLVRDKLVDEFARMGQTATYRPLTTADHHQALIQKIIEEATELPLDGERTELIAEIADVRQALDDLMALNRISPQELTAVQTAKHDKKGGFLSGRYVETLALADDDPWLAYYRAHPDVFREVSPTLPSK